MEDNQTFFFPYSIVHIIHFVFLVFPVCTEILISKGPTGHHDLKIPHLRFLAATIYTIVHNESVNQYDEALRHLQIINNAKQDLVSAKKFVKLTAGLKAKVGLTSKQGLE